VATGRSIDIPITTWITDISREENQWKADVTEDWSTDQGEGALVNPYQYCHSVPSENDLFFL
jgi:hypothetical protein